MKGVSVIIACYKAGDYLRQAVESVHAVAPSLPYEVIIVDDDSRDIETQIALNGLHIADPKVRIVEQPQNFGQSAARNRAIEMAKYDYVFPMDADDLLDPNLPGYMDMAVERLEKNPDSVISYCKGYLFGARNSPFLLPKYSERSLLTDNMIPVYGVFRREDALEIGGYKENLRYTEDWEIWLALHNAQMLRDRPRHVNYIDMPHYLYRQHNHAESVSSSRRMQIVEHMAAISERSPELYDHYLGTTDPAALASIRLSDNTFMKAAFRRISANSIADTFRYGTEWFERRYASWKQQTASDRDNVVHRHI